MSFDFSRFSDFIPKSYFETSDLSCKELKCKEEGLWERYRRAKWLSIEARKRYKKFQLQTEESPPCADSIILNESVILTESCLFSLNILSDLLFNILHIVLFRNFPPEKGVVKKLIKGIENKASCDPLLSNINAFRESTENQYVRSYCNECKHCSVINQAIHMNMSLKEENVSLDNGVTIKSERVSIGKISGRLSGFTRNPKESYSPKKIDEFWGYSECFAIHIQNIIDSVQELHEKMALPLTYSPKSDSF